MRRLVPAFVDYLPEVAEMHDGTLYVSIRGKVVSHRCACGCGREAVTPLAPYGWRLTYDGQDVSLDPSVGNGDFPCRSHYFITKGSVRWMRSMSKDETEHDRNRDRQAQANHHARHALRDVPAEPVVNHAPEPAPVLPPARRRWWQPLLFWRRD